jgi:hypothetical protein
LIAGLAAAVRRAHRTVAARAVAIGALLATYLIAATGA